jgi:hypothetical protein
VSGKALETSAPAERPSQILMRNETKVSCGPVPRCLFGEPLPETTWQMLDDEFLLRGEGDHYFHYRKGAGIMIERGRRVDLSEESLWLNGSVYGAIASMNGLLPIHASAVAHNGCVYAFTGPAGAGKSTLVAALAGYGLPMFCDDTLVLDLSEPDRVICLPGHKRLKLRPDALELAGADAQEKVSRTVDKYYALPPAGDVKTPLPLGQLIFLEVGPVPAITPIVGAERLVRLQDDHQTAQLYAGAQQHDRAQQFAHLARLASQIDMAKFDRPFTPDRFAEGVAIAARHVTQSP